LITAPALVLGGLLAFAVLAVGLAFSSSARAQQPQQATVRVVAPVDPIEKSAGQLSVDVVAENVTNLAAFQFVLSFDDDVLTYKDVQKGDFISSTSREVVCNDPTIQAGSVRLSCVSLRENPPGPDGSGKLATVTFTPKSAGTSPLTLSATKVVQPNGAAMASTTVDAQVIVKGGSDSNTAMIAIIVGIVVAVAVVLVGGLLVLRRRQGMRGPG
jgi:hypothetical protein